MEEKITDKPRNLTWHEEVIIRILLLIATYIAQDKELKDAIHDLDVNIRVTH